MIAKTTRVRSPLKYHGSTRQMADWIIDQFPKHTHYVEPLCGSGAVLFGKPYQDVSEVVNDLDGELINFWRVLQNTRKFNRFVRIVNATPFAEHHFTSPLRPRNDVERAVQ